MTQENLGLPICFALAIASVALPQSLLAEDFKTFAQNYCFQCHNAEKQKGELNLELLLESGTLKADDAKTWDKVLHAVRSREMPPEEKGKAPSESARLAAVEYLGSALDKIHASGPRNPGRVTLRRLNRVEYENTIRDLLGVEFKATEEFPRDEVGYGFDNIGDVLSLSPLLMEKYLDAAERITAKAIVSQIPPWPPVQRFEDKAWQIETKDEDAVRPFNDRYLGFYREGRARTQFQTSLEGKGEIRLRAYQEPAGPEPAAFELTLDGETLARVDVTALSHEPRVYTIPIKLGKGGHRLTVAYVNNFTPKDARDLEMSGDRNVFLDYVEVIGPMDQPRPPLPETHRKIIPREPKPEEEAALAKEIIGQFTGRAFRRPATSDEVARISELALRTRKEGSTFEEAVATGVQAVLVSPQFLFRWELDPPKAEGVRDLEDYELASRLSYFLWSSMPDEELFRLAAEKKLKDQATLLQQVKRMLADEKSAALVSNFAGQWLQIRNMDSIQPDPETFPQFNGELRRAMKEETERFFQSIVREDRSVLELIDADYTYLNERLAKHYGIEGVKGSEFRRVALDPSQRRGGVLTHASVLTITSNPTRTSPVNRGKWVLEQLLGTPPPPPPPNVQPLAEGKKASETASLRERMELHRANPDCAGCHAKMDPIGFALENYDAIGRWRDLDGTFPIDPAGELAGGVKINGVDGLKEALKSREEFLRCLSEKMLTYALGRGAEFYDKPTISELVASLRANNHRFSALVNAIVLSQPFRQRNVES